MGRVKSLAVKRTAKKLLEENPSLFSADFEKNKQIVSKIIAADKKARNSIAGYITRMFKKIMLSVA